MKGTRTNKHLSQDWQTKDQPRGGKQQTASHGWQANCTQKGHSYREGKQQASVRIGGEMYPEGPQAGLARDHLRGGKQQTSIQDWRGTALRGTRARIGAVPTPGE